MRTLSSAHLRTYDAHERLRLQTRATDQSSVNIRLSHQSVNILRRYATAVKYPDCRGDGIPKPIAKGLTNGPMDGLGLLRGGRATRTDRPYRLVRKHHLGRIGLWKMTAALPAPSQHNIQRA